MNDEYPEDYGAYLAECFNIDTGFVDKSYEQWKAAVASAQREET